MLRCRYPAVSAANPGDTLWGNLSQDEASQCTELLEGPMIGNGPVVVRELHGAVEENNPFSRVRPGKERRQRLPKAHHFSGNFAIGFVAGGHGAIVAALRPFHLLALKRKSTVKLSAWHRRQVFE